MASEARRGCGYRKVGGIYLVGSKIGRPCDRLPFPLKACPVCGAGCHFTRSMTEINPLKLLGIHEQSVNAGVSLDNQEDLGRQHCLDRWRPCHVCDPTEDPAYLMMVGERFYPTPEDFAKESRTLGVSKRIPFIPKHLELGITVIYLAHPRACAATKPADQLLGELSLLGDGPDHATSVKLLEAPTETRTLGIFQTFVPRAIEKIYWQSELDAMSAEDREDLAKRGITPVGVPDGDPDHAPRSR